MGFEFSDTQHEIRTASLKHCEQFPDGYWLDCDRQKAFPHAFHRSLAEARWLGIAMPGDLGDSGLCVAEAGIMTQAIAESGAGLTG